MLILMLSALPAAALDSPFPLSSWSGSPTVTTRYGSLRGGTDELKQYVWRGIPYAAAPVGELRWKAPREPQPWANPRQAVDFGAQSLQQVPITGSIRGSEDSLFLNIWRPADERRELPVYVWIHGGGNSIGASDGSSDYFGNSLASKAGIVFVSVNYRLGPLGWFYHPALSTGNPEDDSGNYGTLDLIAALRWIRDNITAFGGDPGNVTIGGESAGGFNVLTLMLAPSARGLFHKAVVQSGYRTETTLDSAAEFSRTMAEKLAQKDGKAKDADSAEAFLASLDKDEFSAWIRGTRARDILSSQASSVSGMTSFPYPIWDGTVLPAEGFAAFSDPSKVADVPLIIGTNKEETKIFQLLSFMNPKDPLYQARALLSSARWKADGADSIADAIVSGDPERNVYLYRFDWGAPDASGKSVMGGLAGLMLGAAHGMEISFFLQNDSSYGNLIPLRIYTRANEAGRKALQNAMGNYLKSFMTAGDPSPIKEPGANGGPTRWESWDASSDTPFFMVLSADRDKAVLKQSYGRTTVASTLEDLDSYEEPLRSRLKELLGWE